MSLQSFRTRKTRRGSVELPCHAPVQREVEGLPFQIKPMPDSFCVPVDMDNDAQPLMQKLGSSAPSPLSQYVNMRESLDSSHGMSAAVYW